MKYLKPYVDEFITDTYGSAVGVINPKAKFKVVIEGHSDEISHAKKQSVIFNLKMAFFLMLTYCRVK